MFAKKLYFRPMKKVDTWNHKKKIKKKKNEIVSIL